MTTKIVTFASIILGLLLGCRAAIAEDYITIRFYPVSKDAYDEDVVLNSVLRVSKTALLSVGGCFEGFLEVDSALEETCSEEWKRYLKECDEEVRRVMYEATPHVSSGFSTGAQIVKLSSRGAVALIVTYIFGGSGGERRDWSIYLIRNDGDKNPRCPSLPFLSGVEVMPGGNAWVETYCRKERVDACARRIFWPTANAFQVSFTSRGTRSSKLARNAPNPKPD
jgi:hypothetical protein